MGGMPKRAEIAVPSPLGSGGTFASISWISRTRRASSEIASSPRFFFSGRLVVMSARDRSSRSQSPPPISRAKRRTAESVHPGS
jgi:hypothetical protein